MLFNSLGFLAFFPVVLWLNFALPHRHRWWLLLGASYFFYMCWRPEYALLILFSTSIDYVAALAMARAGARRKLWLALSLSGNLGLLFAFKYLDFFRANIGWTEPLGWLLPVGISFYTFQSLSYTIDVYRGKTQPERHFGIFALYVSFFPQLVAGPIERSERLLPQFRQVKDFDYRLAADGLKVMLWGFFKKLVIADRLAALVDTVYSAPAEFDGACLTVATVAFAFQIYCDFSGYSDIAIGAARMLGFDLMRNFDRPYAAVSIPDFWRRWHISLSTWFRDYVYIPLGGSRVGPWRLCANLLIVFLVSGLWHGANWTFVVWGAIHGGVMVLAVMTRGRVRQVPRPLAVAATFFVVCIAWIFFRANNVAEGMYVLTHLHTGWSLSISGIRQSLHAIGFARQDYVIAALAIALMEVVQWREARGPITTAIRAWPTWRRWVCYSFLFWTVVFFGVYANKQFIYFVF